MKKKPRTPSSSSSSTKQQPTLDSFISRQPKRKQDTSDTEELKATGGGGVEESPTADLKRSRAEEEDKAPTTTPTRVLTPDQRKAIKEKQMSARLKLVSSKLKIVDPTSIGLSWYTELLEVEFGKNYFASLNEFYVKACARGTVYPRRENIFSWTRYCDIRDVKVVIIGQDPYHGHNQAHGLCFSVVKGVHPPPSLVNMFKELVDDPGVEAFRAPPGHGCLEGWAEQGVLLLNAVLTVDASKPNSHKDQGWETLTTSVIKWISNNMKDVVFLLWGAYAQKKAAVVDKSRHVLLQSVHPSPLSAHRGFLGCRHFSKCNELLVKNGKEPIRWEHLP